MSFLKKFSLLNLLFLSLLFSACEDEPVQPPEPPAPLTFVEACCAESGLQESVSGGNVFLANVFTPNGDGINDFALISGEQGIEIEEFVVYKNDTVHFSRVNFQPNDANFAWDGLTVTGFRNDYFNYSLTISGKTFQGIISSWLCNGDTTSIPDNRLQCQYSSQWNGSNFDPALDTFENCD